MSRFEHFKSAFSPKQGIQHQNWQLTTFLSSLPVPLRLVTIGALFIIGCVAFTICYTRLRYRYHLYRISPTSSKPNRPAAIPYNYPLIGQALDFMDPRPGRFWRKLTTQHPVSTGACTLNLGGQTTHILFDSTALQTLFKAKGPSRDRLNDMLLNSAFGMPPAETAKYYGYGLPPQLDEKGRDIGPKRKLEEMWMEYLIKTEAVAELTREFSSRLKTLMETDQRNFNDIGILEWLRPLMFKASTTALMGSRLFEIYPDLVDDIWAYDDAFRRLLFGLPDILVRKEKKVLRSVLTGMRKWEESAREETDGKPENPKSQNSWEPIYGSRATRARQYFYNDIGMNLEGRAGVDFGFIFALSGNAIPTTAWMLSHIVDDRSLYQRLFEEVQTCQSEKGDVDIGKLIALPLLQSLFYETLRMYSDLFITRDLPNDVVLLINEGKSSLQFDKGSMIMSPTFLGHHDESIWGTPHASAESFYPERFLKQDPATGKCTFSLAAGKFYPFGGGKTICPGRVFAKQEILGAVAMTLLQFDIEKVGYVDLKGKPTDKFPGFKEAFGSAGMIAMNGDIKVRMSRRRD